MQERVLGLVLLGGLAVAAAWAQAPPAAEDTEVGRLITEEKNEVDQLIDEYRQREGAFYASRSESGELDFSLHPASEYRSKFRALAKRYAGQPQALAALTWLTSNAWGAGEDVKWALAELARDHAARPEIGDALKSLQYAGPWVGEEALVALYDAVLSKNQDRETLARALYQKGFLLVSEWQMPTSAPAAAPTSRKQQALELFRKVVADYSGTVVARRAESGMFEMEKLQVGMTAPDLAGSDGKGKQIHLADYRGKVVVLSFWGYW